MRLFVRELDSPGNNIRILNLGGGYSTSSISRVSRDLYDRLPPEHRRRLVHQIVEASRDFDFVTLAEEISRMNVPNDMKLVMEPGRFLVSDCMIYVSQVVGIKDDSDITWLVLDGGVNHLPTSGPNEVRNVRLVPASGGYVSAPKTYAIAGPVCHRGDVFSMNMPLETVPRVGDLVAILATGAYSISMATSFNSYQAPVIHFDAPEGAKEVWRRQTFEDLFLNPQSVNL